MRIVKKVGPVSYIVRDIIKLTEHWVHRNQISPFKRDNELQLILPENTEVIPFNPIDPDDLDPDDPINVMLLGLVRSPDALNLSNLQVHERL